MLLVECNYAECNLAECHYAECYYAECRYAEYRYAECRYAEYRNAECRYAEYRFAKYRRTDRAKERHVEHLSLSYVAKQSVTPMITLTRIVYLVTLEAVSIHGLLLYKPAST